MAAQGIYGEELLAEAIKMAGQAGFSKLAVTSGMGVRLHYRELDFERDGYYIEINHSIISV